MTDDQELTRDEATALADDLGNQLYRAEDRIGFIREMLTGRTEPVEPATVLAWLDHQHCARAESEQQQIARLNDERDRLAAQIDAIRVVHFTEIGNEYGNIECGVCRESNPCQTIAILTDSEDVPDHVGDALTKLAALNALADQLEADPGAGSHCDASMAAASAIREILYSPAPSPARTTPDNSPTSKDAEDNPGR